MISETLICGLPVVYPSGEHQIDTCFAQPLSKPASHFTIYIPENCSQKAARWYLDHVEPITGLIWERVPAQKKSIDIFENSRENHFSNYTDFVPKKLVGKLFWRAYQCDLTKWSGQVCCVAGSMVRLVKEHPDMIEFLYNNYRETKNFWKVLEVMDAVGEIFNPWGHSINSRYISSIRPKGLDKFLEELMQEFPNPFQVKDGFLGSSLFYRNWYPKEDQIREITKEQIDEISNGK